MLYKRARALLFFNRDRDSKQKQQHRKASYGSLNFRTEGYGWDCVELDAYSRSSSGWSSHFAYYRIVIGSYGDKSILKLNADLTITPKQVAKVVEKMVEKYDAVCVGEGEANGRPAPGSVAEGRGEQQARPGDFAHYLHQQFRQGGSL